MGKRLRFRCNPVLPEVYDDALSYYEVLGKITNAVNELGDQIDEGLEDYIKEALPELIADVIYDAQTGTLELTLVDDVTEDQILNDPIKRIAVNGLSRPVVDEEARKWIESSWLYNKKLCFYGDSTLFVAESYYPIINASGVPASTERRGASGTTLTTAGWPLINSATDLSTFDYVFVCYGINDWSGISRKRFCDSVRAAAQKIIAAGAEPVFVFPWVVYIPTLASDGFINNFGCDMAGYIDEAINICQELNVKYFNLCELANVTPANYISRLTPSSNGYYLHENADLGAKIAKMILNGNFCTGKCRTGNFTGKPFTNWLPLDFSFLNFSNTQSLLTDTIYRKGKTVSFASNSGATKSFKAINSGQICRITGYANLSETNAYITAGYINEYDQTHTFTPICRINDKSDFDFSFTPPNGGGAWRLAFQLSAGSAAISDLTLYPDNGSARVVGNQPNAPGAKAITYNSNFVPVVQGYEIYNNDSTLLSSYHVRVVEEITTVGNYTVVGNISFYPEHTLYGSAHIGERTLLFRVNAVGTIDFYTSASIPANANIIFDAVDATPTPFTNIQ